MAPSIPPTPPPSTRPSPSRPSPRFSRWFRRKPPSPDHLILDYLPDGEAIGRAPLSRSAGMVLRMMVVTVISALVWAGWAEVDRVVVAPGRLVTTRPTIVVQPLETAVVRDIDVTVGQAVVAGQRLATLDPTFAAADLADLTGGHAAALALETRLRAERDGTDFPPPLGPPPASGDSDPMTEAMRGPMMDQAAILARRQAEYAAKLSSLDARLALARADLEADRADREGLKRRLAVVSEIEAIRESLHERRTGSRLLLLEARDERLRLLERMEELARREPSAIQEIKRAEADRAAFIDEWRRTIAEELVTAERERASLDERLAKARRRASLVELTAPVNAVVLDIAQRSSGSVAREAEPLFTLVPIGVPLEAEVDIPSADVGFARLNDPVRIKLDAFPFQRHGTIDGRLRTISADAFPREPERGGGAVFRARVELLGTAPSASPPGTRISPGMVVTAEIIVGRRTVLSYLSRPVIRLLDDSMREP